MESGDHFQLVQIAYWLALSTWFGGTLFIAIAAQVIHRTVGDAKPILPNVLAVNLEGQHGTLLAGTIVSNLLQRMTLIELICGGVLLVTTVAQGFLIDLTSNNRTAMVLRAAMILAAVALVIYQWRVTWPKVQLWRDQFIAHADEPDVANPAKDQFDKEQRTSVTTLMVVIFLLLGTILFSGNITPKRLGPVAPATPAM